MQLVIPKRKDIRLYAMFSERPFSAMTVAGVMDYMRNARTHVETIVNNNQVKLTPVMVGTSSQLKLTRISNLGAIPDFKSEAAFAQTMLPIPTGFNASGRCNGQNEGLVGNDSVTPFTMSTVGKPWITNGTIASLIPSRVGNTAIPNTNWVLPQMYSDIARGQSTSYGGIMTQGIALLRTTSDVFTSPTVSQHESDSSPTTRPVYNNINADTGSVLLLWCGHVVISGNSRFQLPYKSGTVLPTVPTAAIGVPESGVDLSYCVIPMLWGNEVKLFKPEQSKDYTASTQQSGNTPTISMSRIELPFEEVISV